MSEEKKYLTLITSDGKIITDVNKENIVIVYTPIEENTVKEYIDIRWDNMYHYDTTVTDTDMKLKLMTSINDISYKTIFANYGEDSIDFLSRYLSGSITTSRYVESPKEKYYQDWAQTNTSEYNSSYIAVESKVNADVIPGPTPYRDIKDITLDIDMSKELATDGVRVYSGK